MLPKLEYVTQFRTCKTPKYWNLLCELYVVSIVNTQEKKVFTELCIDALIFSIHATQQQNSYII